MGIIQLLKERVRNFRGAAKEDVLATILQWMPVISHKVFAVLDPDQSINAVKKQQLLAGIVMALALIFLFARSLKNKKHETRLTLSRQ